MGVQFTTGQLLSLTAVLLLAFAAALGMAFNIDAIAMAYQATNAEAGLVASAEMGAIATGVLSFARFAGRWPTRRIYIVAITCILAGNIVSMFAPDLMTLLVIRIPTGLALGAVSATSMAAASKSATPEATFGVINAAVGAMGMVIAYVLPRAINWGEPLSVLSGGTFRFDQLDGLYVVYIVCGFAAYLFVRGVPSVHQDSSGPVVERVAPGAFGWVVLAAVGFMFFGHGSLGIFLVRAARELGLSGETIGYVFMAGAVFGIVVPLAAGYIGARMRPLLPLTVIIVVLLIACFTVATTTTPLTFYLAVPLFGALPMAFLPILLGVLSRYDQSGTLAGAHAAFVLMGGAIAPFAGGWVRDQAENYALNGYFACGCILIAFLVMLPLIRADGDASRLRSGSPLPTASH